MRQFSITVHGPRGEQHVFTVDAVHFGDALLAAWFATHGPNLTAVVRHHQYFPPGSEPTLFAAVAAPLKGSSDGNG